MVLINVLLQRMKTPDPPMKAMSLLLQGDEGRVSLAHSCRPVTCLVSPPPTVNQKAKANEMKMPSQYYRSLKFVPITN